ncbi:MAG: aminotransferase class I/II-fold pyridoxal phosphate-dependent enzyme [Promethearchaeota archaeon]
MEFKYIQETALYKTFSDLGKRIFLPDGIYYWSGRAKKEAEIIGTIGSAYGFEKEFIDGGSDEWVPCYLKEIKNYTKLHVNQIVPYASIGGLQDTREIWKKLIIRKALYNENTDIDKIKRLEKYITTPIITSGVTNGIYLVCSIFLNPGESIISPNKRWGNYDNIVVKHLGAKIESFDFFKDNRINLRGLKEIIQDVSNRQDKIVIILNFPNNPTGYNPTHEEARDLISLLKETYYIIKKPMIIIVDDAYESYVYNDKNIKNSMFYELHLLDEDIIPIKLDGITKELLLYGGRIGFVSVGLKPNWVKTDEELEVLKKEVENKLEGMNRSTISNCNHYFQAITYKLLNNVGIDKINEARDKVVELLKARYEKINAELSKIESPDISVDPNSGGFFLFLNLNPDKIKANEFADHLLKKYKVGVIPIEKLNDNINGIRIAYCSIDIKQIPELINRINLALKDF